MSKRTNRVNELLKREIAMILHTDFRSEAVAITITGVDVSPDLRQARVGYSVIGDEDARNAAESLLIRNRSEIRRKVGNAVILKYNPELRFYYDASLERAASVIDLLDQLDDDTNSDSTSR